MSHLLDALSAQEMLIITTNLIACITSLKCMKIPNWLTLPAALIGAILNSLQGHIVSSIGGWLLLILVNLLGGKRRYPFGAVKLFAANGAALGPVEGFLNFGIFITVHCLFALTIIRSVEGAEEKAEISARAIPLGPMIFIATVITILIKRVAGF
jgi:prepilin signal peptidase PulO-like enzyme (type II secretory pathway)